MWTSEASVSGFSDYTAELQWPRLSSQPQNTEERSPEELPLQLWTRHGRFILQKYLLPVHLLTQWTDISLNLGPTAYHSSPTAT